MKILTSSLKILFSFIPKFVSQHFNFLNQTETFKPKFWLVLKIWVFNSNFHYLTQNFRSLSQISTFISKFRPVFLNILTCPKISFFYLKILTLWLKFLHFISKFQFSAVFLSQNFEFSAQNFNLLTLRVLNHYPRVQLIFWIQNQILTFHGKETLNKAGFSFSFCFSTGGNMLPFLSVHRIKVFFFLSYCL